jgi:uncharacterized protein (TIRG00374 family)
MWVVIYDFALALGALVVLAALVRRRWPIALQGVVATITAAIFVAVVARWVGDSWRSTSAVAGVGDGVTWPAAAFALAAAPLFAVSSDLVKPARRIGVRILVVGGVAGVLAGRASPSGVLAALAAAAAAAAVARLAVGTTAGHLSRRDVVRLLAALGVTIRDVESLTRGSDGLLLAQVTDTDGRPLQIKVHGRDAAEGRLAQRLWRALLYRDGGAALAQARSAGLERETRATLLAAARGAPVWDVVTAGRPGGPDDALVLRRSGTRLADLPAGSLDDGAADAAWRSLASLHAAGFAHLGLSPTSVALREDATVAFTDFDDAVNIPEPERLQMDEAQMLVLVAIMTSADRSVERAAAALGQERLAGLLPYLQAPAFPARLRDAAKAAKLDVDALRAATAAAAETPEPELAKLRRVSWGGLLRTGLLLLAAGTILTAAANLDFDQLWSALSNAAVPLLVAGMIVAQLPRIAQAISTLGSVSARLPFGPVYVMQLATSFLNVALPSAAARMMLSVRFFQRQGVTPATAVAAGLIDSLIGNVIQAVLLAGLLIFSSVSLDLPANASSSDDGSGTHWLIILVFAVAIVAIVTAIAVRRIREAIVGRVRVWWPEVRASAAPLRNPQKLLQLVGGNLAAELLFAAALSMILMSLGSDIGLMDALYVNVSASLLAMFIPVPGGIGVTEGAMIVGLTGLGVSSETAFAAVILYRLATFYLPPLWGWFALRWLEQNRFV